jgi:putative hydrolase of the HAD superfamily
MESIRPCCQVRIEEVVHRRHLLIDLDGVIRLWDANDSLKTWPPVAEIQEVAFEKALLGQAVTGAITDEEWRARIIRILAARFPESECKQSVEAWSKSNGRVNQEVLDVLSGSSFAENICLITNATSRLDRDLDSLGLRGIFEHIFNSSNIGVAKPDAQIFKYALEAIGCSTSEVLYVDDSPQNVEAASTLGISSHPYTQPGLLREFLSSS